MAEADMEDRQTDIATGGHIPASISCFTAPILPEFFTEGIWADQCRLLRHDADDCIREACELNSDLVLVRTFQTD